MSSVPSSNQFCYVQKESSWGVIPNSSGTATVGNTDACRIISLDTSRSQELIDRPDKLPTADYTIGAGGRKTANWTCSMSLASATRGTKPDSDEFWEAWFGQAGNAVASTSVTYSCADTTPSLSIWNFVNPSTASQQVAFGSIVRQFRVQGGQNVATVEFSGEAKSVLDSVTMASLTDGNAEKGGLTGTTFPSQPSSPVTNGTFVVGFTGGATLDGNAFSEMRALTLTADSGRELSHDNWNSYVAGAPAINRRSVQVEFSIYDDDTANMNSLKSKCGNNTPIDISLQFGTTAGNIWTFNLKNVVLANPTYDYGQLKRAVNFTGRAYATSATSKDAITLVIT